MKLTVGTEKREVVAEVPVYKFEFTRREAIQLARIMARVGGFDALGNNVTAALKKQGIDYSDYPNPQTHVLYEGMGSAYELGKEIQ